jgi:hypothetical protein
MLVSGFQAFLHKHIAVIAPAAHVRPTSAEVNLSIYSTLEGSEITIA